MSNFSSQSATSMPAQSLFKTGIKVSGGKRKPALIRRKYNENEKSFAVWESQAAAESNKRRSFQRAATEVAKANSETQAEKKELTDLKDKMKRSIMKKPFSHEKRERLRKTMDATEELLAWKEEREGLARTKAIHKFKK